MYEKMKMQSRDENSEELNIESDFRLTGSRLLNQGIYECLICCSNIKCNDPIWSCENCYRSFHLYCIQEWGETNLKKYQEELKIARQKEEEFKKAFEFPCPHCRSAYAEIPQEYRCFCSKRKNPKMSPYINAHSCGEICKKYLNCGVHKCKEICHYGACNSCPLDGKPEPCYCGQSMLTFGCGEIEEEKDKRCGKICSKILHCGKHTCPDKCHKGECKPCQICEDDFIKIDCRCRESKKVLVDYRKYDENGFNRETGKRDVLCKRKCNRLLKCGKHKCKNICCDWKSLPTNEQHVCNKKCGKLLKCGLHHCEGNCGHPGDCPDCGNVSFDDYVCPCGKTVLLAPIKCGTKLPKCKHECSIKRECGHPPNHRCHPLEISCPKCIVMTDKRCRCKSKIIQNVPCHMEPSCGKKCNKKLPCGHRCPLICHKDSCIAKSKIRRKKVIERELKKKNSKIKIFDQNSSYAIKKKTAKNSKRKSKKEESKIKYEGCDKICGKIKECGHPCQFLCHPNYECPDVICMQKMIVTCKCGRQQETTTCYMGGDPRDLELLGVRVHPGIECDEECLRWQRLEKIRKALGIQTEEEKQNEIEEKNKFKEKQKRSIKIKTNRAPKTKNPQSKPTYSSVVQENHRKTKQRHKHREGKKRQSQRKQNSGNINKNEDPQISMEDYIDDIIDEGYSNYNEQSGFLYRYCIKEPAFLVEIEGIFEDFINESSEKTLDLKPMSSSDNRHVVHSLAQIYYIKTYSHGMEPNRYISLEKTNKTKIPYPLFSSYIEKIIRIKNQKIEKLNLLSLKRSAIDLNEINPKNVPIIHLFDLQNSVKTFHIRNALYPFESVLENFINIDNQNENSMKSIYVIKWLDDHNCFIVFCSFPIRKIALDILVENHSFKFAPIDKLSELQTILNPKDKIVQEQLYVIEEKRYENLIKSFREKNKEKKN
eukprot:Anaeramoba_flamelloidesa88567_56.p1 GENE.a88567_56~~a88567_56.p1  ORF type:complete len:1031 (-),score=243.69 a88567_56:55-2859(-)